jgi:hypothetical protein
MSVKTLSVIIGFVLTLVSVGIGYGELKGSVAKNEENVDRIYSQLEKQDKKLDKIIEKLIVRGV